MDCRIKAECLMLYHVLLIICPMCNFCLQFVDCKIVKKSNSGFDVELMPSKMPALLPKMHLSDHLGICDLLWDAHQEGDVIEGAVYMGNANVIVSFDTVVEGTLIVTRSHVC